MRRIVLATLVLMQLAQGMAFCHSHAGTGVAEPVGHSQRPHFHFGGFLAFGHDHDHDHDDAPISDHDSDAVYVSDEAVAAGTSLRLQPEPWRLLVLSIDTIFPRFSPTAEVVPPRSLPPPFAAPSRCPIFLQTLALLI